MTYPRVFDFFVFPTYCGLFQNSLTWIFRILFTFIMTLSQLLLSVWQPSTLNCLYLQDTFKLVSENLDNIVIVPVSIKLRLKS